MLPRPPISQLHPEQGLVAVYGVTRPRDDATADAEAQGAPERGVCVQLVGPYRLRRCAPLAFNLMRTLPAEADCASASHARCDSQAAGSASARSERGLQVRPRAVVAALLLRTRFE